MLLTLITHLCNSHISLIFSIDLQAINPSFGEISAVIFQTTVSEFEKSICLNTISLMENANITTYTFQNLTIFLPQIYPFSSYYYEEVNFSLL